jgi:hypothetical protein
MKNDIKNKISDILLEANDFDLAYNESLRHQRESNRALTGTKDFIRRTGQVSEEYLSKYDEVLVAMKKLESSFKEPTLNDSLTRVEYKGKIDVLAEKYLSEITEHVKSGDDFFDVAIELVTDDAYATEILKVVLNHITKGKTNIITALEKNLEQNYSDSPLKTKFVFIMPSSEYESFKNIISKSNISDVSTDLFFMNHLNKDISTEEMISSVVKHTEDSFNCLHKAFTGYSGMGISYIADEGTNLDFKQEIIKSVSHYLSEVGNLESNGLAYGNKLSFEENIHQSTARYADSNKLVTPVKEANINVSKRGCNAPANKYSIKKPKQ